MDHFFNMLRISNNPSLPVGDDENATDADEPPDDQVPELNQNFHKENAYTKSIQKANAFRRESLLTRAIMAGSDASPSSPRTPDMSRGLSTASSHSFASTAELTSDADSPTRSRSASPSPPPQVNRIPFTAPKHSEHTTKILIAPVTKDDKPDVAEVGEAAIEKTLGRKRCIMFACNNAPSAGSKDISPAPIAKVEEKPTQPAPRKCRLTFACPSRQDKKTDQGLFNNDSTEKKSEDRRVSPAPSPRRSPIPKSVPELPKLSVATVSKRSSHASEVKPDRSSPPRSAFHEFASSFDETEDWVEKGDELNRPKLTLDDCLRKENAIRRIGKEAEEEAEAEEREQEELENELDDDDDNDVEDDFAPSDQDESDGGNESDDEEGFADSDDESDAGSDYQFWAPSTTTAATSTDNIPHFIRQGQRSRSSSASSTRSESMMAKHPRLMSHRKPSKLAMRLRPGTPELPDSTDFVCGTLDEDRPLEAAYISCREQKRKEKHVPIPQDIDPSFPTTDPEDEEDDDEAVADSSDHMWIKDQFTGFDDEGRGRRNKSVIRITPLHSPTPAIAPPRPAGPPLKMKRGTNRSPPPPKHNVARSPPPRRLFDHPPKRLRSPPPMARLRSPRGSPTNMKLPPLGITINRLAQRPKNHQTSSLPHTPNPFFRNWRNGSPAISRIASAAVSPGDTEPPRHDIHVRGPVDIVIGLEKKRQKRKEKFWRQHCRKAAKEQAEKRPPPGRGVERMKELGLECAERTRGYGLGQQAQLVLSL